MEVKIYFAVKVLCALFIFYHLWVFLFCRKIYGLWDKLHNWARITRVRLWNYRKKRMAEKAKRERRKKIYGKDLPTDKPKPIQAETPQKVEESPPVDDDPNEVMGKSNIIYYNDIEADRKIPTHSLPLKEVELSVDKDINPDDVEDNIEPQKGLTEEDKRELMEPEGVIPDPDFDKSLTYEDMNNLVDVLNSDNPDEQKSIRAASTIHHKLANTVILDFLVNKVSNEDKVNQLLQECLDANGNPLPKRRKASKVKSFDIPCTRLRRRDTRNEGNGGGGFRSVRYFKSALLPYSLFIRIPWRWGKVPRRG